MKHSKIKALRKFVGGVLLRKEASVRFVSETLERRFEAR